MTVISVSTEAENIAQVKVELPKGLYSENAIIDFYFKLKDNLLTSVNDHLPFILRRLLLKGVIPVINDKFVYETRVLLEYPIHAIDISNKLTYDKILSSANNKNIHIKDIITIIPSNRPINILGLYIKDKMYTFSFRTLDTAEHITDDSIPGYKYIYKPEYAPSIESTLLNEELFSGSYVGVLSKYNSINIDKTHLFNLSMMEGVSMTKDMKEFFKEVNLAIPFCEYETVPFGIMITNNEFEDYMHKIFKQTYRRDKSSERKILQIDFIKDYVKKGKAVFVFRSIFGDSEFNKLKPKNNSYAALMSSMDKVKRDRVEEEIQKEENTITAVMNNKCDHVKLIRTLNTAVSVTDIKNAYENIKPYMDLSNSKINTFISCNNCQYNLICPHKLVQLNYLISDKKFRDIMSEFNQFLDRELKNKFAICKICGEEIYKQQMDLIGDHSPITSYEDRVALWHDSVFVINNYVKFKESIYDKTALIQNMVNRCYHMIMGLVSGLPPGSNVEKWRKVYANRIFAAYLINLEKITDGDIKFDINKFLYTIAVTQKINTKRAIDEYRNKLSDIDVNMMLKSKDIEFYLLNEPIYVLAATLTSKHVFDYLGTSYNHNKIYEHLPYIENIGGTVETVGTVETMSGTEKIFNKGNNKGHNKGSDKGSNKGSDNSSSESESSESDIQGGAKVQIKKFNRKERVEVVNRNTNKNVVLRKVEKQKDLTLDEKKSLYTYPCMNMYYSFPIPQTVLPYNKSDLGKMRVVQLKLIYNAIIKYGKSGLWANISDEGHVNNTDKPTLEKIYKVDILSELHRELTTRKPTTLLPDSGVYKKFIKNNPVSLAEIYAEDGSKIKWDKFVYKDGNVDIKEGSINKYGEKPIDLYSSKWNLYRSDVRKIDDKKIRDTLDNIVMGDNIIHHFFNICPEGNRHNNNPCTKCGYYNNMSKEHRNEFIIKYKTKYESDKTDKTKTITESMQDKTNLNIVRTNEEYELNMELSDSLIQNFSARFNFHIEVVKILGQCEGIKYDDIIDGTYIIKHPSSANHTSITYINSYINEYFNYKTQQGLKSNSFKDYNRWFSMNRIKKELLKASEEVKVEYYKKFINSMRAILYNDAIKFHEDNPVKASDIIKRIVTVDTLLCKNNIVQHAKTDIDYNEPTDADELGIIAKMDATEEGVTEIQEFAD